MTLPVKLRPDIERHARRRRRLRSLDFLPTMLTLGNLVCGFATIHFALRAMYDLGAGLPGEFVAPTNLFRLERVFPTFLSIGAGLILLGMVFDCFDGLVARVTRSTTNFGGQLDSLADVVTFGVAPATLMVAFMTKELAGESILPSPISEHFLGRAAWVSAAVYVSFTAVRLARFNVEHAIAGADYRSFKGMPSPGAACTVCALILFQDQSQWVSTRNILVYALPAISLTLAFLMVSRIPYRRFPRAYLLGRQPFGQFTILILGLAILGSYDKALTLLVVVLWYAISGPLFAIVRALRGQPALAPKSDAPAIDDRTEAPGGASDPSGGPRMQA